MNTIPTATETLMDPDGLALGRRIMALLRHAATFSSGDRGVTRLFLSPEHRAVADWLIERMTDAGLVAALDDAGNVVGRLRSARHNAKTLIVGSHQDTVRQGGAFDGILGVILPLACLEDLTRRGLELPFNVELVAFGDEEGCRFQQTLTGSKALAGTFDPTALQASDAEGITMEHALRDFGMSPERIPALARPAEQVIAFLEVHIEQGPVLESAGLPVGVVTAISGIERHLIQVTGKAGHAGTTPMLVRRDALTGAAELVVALETRCRRTEGLVGVVGDLSVSPGAVNVIPESVAFPIEVRAPSDVVRAEACNDIFAAFRDIAGERRLDLKVEKTYESPSTACSDWVMDLLDRAVSEVGVTPLRLPSGAGHDGMAMKALCDIGMLFVRCKDGLSHHPDEDITAEDAAVAAMVLRHFLEALSKDSRIAGTA